MLVMCHTRELAFQISKEYERFSKYMPNVKVRGERNLGQEAVGRQALGGRLAVLGHPCAVSGVVT